MLGKIASQVQGSAKRGVEAAAASGQRKELFGATKMDAANLPRAPTSAFRKRPVRLDYDKNEYFMFRLPSEKHFLMSNFEHQDLFGKRQGIDHSPHLKEQMNIDNRILLGLIGVSFCMLIAD